MLINQTLFATQNLSASPEAWNNCLLCPHFGGRIARRGLNVYVRILIQKFVTRDEENHTIC
jgi:hypothetical protein